MRGGLGEQVVFVCPCGTQERVVGPGRGLQGQKAGGQSEARGREGGSEGNAGKEGLCARWDEATRAGVGCR